MMNKSPYTKHFNLNKKLSWEDRLAGTIDGYKFSGSLKEWYTTCPRQFLDTARMTKRSIAPAVYKHFIRKTTGTDLLPEPWKGNLR